MASLLRSIATVRTSVLSRAMSLVGYQQKCRSCQWLSRHSHALFVDLCCRPVASQSWSVCFVSKRAKSESTVSSIVSTSQDYHRHQGRSFFTQAWLRFAVYAAGGVSVFLCARECLKRDGRLPFIGCVEAASPGGTSDSSTGSGTVGSARDRFNFIADVVDRVAPAVVYIEIRNMGSVRFGGGSTISNGSGFLVDADGLIMTNAHVVMKAPRSSVQVRLHDGRVLPAVVEAVDPKSDLATLRVACDDRLPFIELGDSSSLRAGEWVVALGSPLNLTNTATVGVVSSVVRQCSELGLPDRDMQYIQTDAAITFGNSGGPLVDLDGRVIGVNAMKVSQGISFAIPIDHAKEFLARAEKWRRAHPSVKPPSTARRYLGVTMLSLTPPIIQEIVARQPDFPADIDYGVLVVKVLMSSPAFQAGVRPGDVVTHINGKPVRAASDVYQALEEGSDVLSMSVRRLTESFTFTAHPEPVH